MTSLRKQFQLAQNKFKKQVKVKVEEVADIVADSLVEGATIDTGLHSANFLPSVDREKKSYLDFDYFGINPLELNWPNGRQIAESKAKEIAKKIPGFRIGQEIIWVNNVPYHEDIDALTTAMVSADVAKARANSEVNKK